jgi:hypothetical protein
MPIPVCVICGQPGVSKGSTLFGGSLHEECAKHAVALAWHLGDPFETGRARSRALVNQLMADRRTVKTLESRRSTAHADEIDRAKTRRDALESWLDSIHRLGVARAGTGTEAAVVVEQMEQAEKTAKERWLAVADGSDDCST